MQGVETGETDKTCVFVT